MPSGYAAICGACTGLLAGFAISMLLNLGVSDAVYRIIVLTISGAWMGILLAWLDHLLTPSQTRADKHGTHLP